MGGRPNYGPTAQARTKRLLEALLGYASDELEGCDYLKIKVNWQTGYGELLRRVGGERHQSCILLTSREKPEEVAAFEGESLPVRSLQVRGLQVEDAKNIFKDKGFSGSEMSLAELIDLYGGNPLALKVITTMIQEVFNGNVADFLKQNTLVLGDRLRTLLKQHQLCQNLGFPFKQLQNFPVPHLPQ